MSTPRHPQITRRKSNNKSYPAYCHNITHKGYLTTAAIKSHECLGKNCPYLQKFEEHEWWHQRELLKAQRKRSKMLKRGL